MAPDPRGELSKPFRQAERTYRRALFARLLALTGAIGLASSGLLLLALALAQQGMRPTPLPVTFGLAFLVTGAVTCFAAGFSLAAARLLQPKSLPFARRLDQLLGLRDSLATSIALRQAGSASPMLELLERQVLKSTDQLAPHSFRPRPPRAVAFLATLLAFGALLMPTWAPIAASAIAPPLSAPPEPTAPNGEKPAPIVPPDWDPTRWSIALDSEEPGKRVFPQDKPIELQTTLARQSGPTPLGVRGRMLARVVADDGGKEYQYTIPNLLTLPKGEQEQAEPFLLGDADANAFLEPGKYHVTIETTLEPLDQTDRGAIPADFLKHRFVSNRLPIEIAPPTPSPDGGTPPEPPPLELGPLTDLLNKIKRTVVDPLVREGETVVDWMTPRAKKAQPSGRGDAGPPYEPTPQERAQLEKAIDRAIENESIPLEERDFLKRYYRRD